MMPFLARSFAIVRLRLRSLFGRGAVEQELERELRSHIELQIEEYLMHL